MSLVNIFIKYFITEKLINLNLITVNAEVSRFKYITVESSPLLFSSFKTLVSLTPTVNSAHWHN